MQLNYKEETNMSITLQPPVKYVKAMKLFLFGPSYSGKTYSAIQLAVGIVMKVRGCTEAEAFKHIILVDSEYGRGTLHSALGPYNYYEIKAPYHSNKLVATMKELEEMDQIDVVIYDSLTHYWNKTGGILDRKTQKDMQPGGNSYTNWNEFTGYFNSMLDVILQSKKHVICTARSKNDTVLEPNSKGKMVPKTYGLKPELRDGIEFEFDIAFNIEKDSHDLLMEKGVPGIDPIYPAATPELGIKLFDLFSAGAVVAPRQDDDVRDSLRRLSKENNMVNFMMLELSGRRLDDLSRKELDTLENKLVKEIKDSQVKKVKK